MQRNSTCCPNQRNCQDLWIGVIGDLRVTLESSGRSTSFPFSNGAPARPGRRGWGPCTSLRFPGPWRRRSVPGRSMPLRPRRPATLRSSRPRHSPRESKWPRDGPRRAARQQVRVVLWCRRRFPMWLGRSDSAPVGMMSWWLAMSRRRCSGVFSARCSRTRRTRHPLRRLAPDAGAQPVPVAGCDVLSVAIGQICFI